MTFEYYNLEDISKIYIMMIYVFVMTFLSYKIYDKIFNKKNKDNKNENKIKNKNRNNDKKLVKKITGFLVITCNTILYCVLYNKIQGFYLVLQSVYILLLIYIGLYDIDNKIITNKSNMMLCFIGIINFITCNWQDENFIRIIIFKIITLIIFSIFLILIRKMFGGQIGGGDIKMLISLAIYFNMAGIFRIITMSVLIAGLYATYLLLFMHKEKTYKFAYGEFISMSTIVEILLN